MLLETFKCQENFPELNSKGMGLSSEKDKKFHVQRQRNIQMMHMQR